MYTGVASPAAEKEWYLRRSTASCKRRKDLLFSSTATFLSHSTIRTPYKHLLWSIFQGCYPILQIHFQDLSTFFTSIWPFETVNAKIKIPFPFPCTLTSWCWNNFCHAATSSLTWSLPASSMEATYSSRFPQQSGACGLQAFLLIRSNSPALQGRTDFPSGHLNELIPPCHQTWCNPNKYKTTGLINLL